MRATNIRELFWIVLRYSVVLVIAIAVFGGLIGFFLAGRPGLIAALIGAGLTFIFSILTVGSVALGARLQLVGFYAVVLGGWIVKILIFAIALFLLQGADFIDGPSLFFSVTATVLATLVVDSVAVLRARIPVV